MSESTGGISPMVWLAGGAVVLVIALIAHNNASGGGSTIVPVGATSVDSASTALQTAQLEANASLASEIIQVAGAEDVAQIAAKNNVDTINAQAAATSAQSGTGTARYSLARSAMTQRASANLQAISLDRVAGAVSDGVDEASHLF